MSTAAIINVVWNPTLSGVSNINLGYTVVWRLNEMCCEMSTDWQRPRTVC